MKILQLFLLIILINNFSFAQTTQADLPNIIPVEDEISDALTESEELSGIEEEAVTETETKAPAPATEERPAAETGTFLSNFLSRFEDVSFGLGNLTRHLKKIQIDETGKTNSFELNPIISANTRFRIYWRLSLLPELLFSLPDKGEDENIKRFNYFFSFPFGLVWENFTFRLGIGLSWYRISADGGTVLLNNGNEESTFYLPEDPVSGRNIIILSGVEFSFFQRFSARAEFYTYNVTDSNSRAFSYLLSFHYHIGAWGQWNWW